MKLIPSVFAINLRVHTSAQVLFSGLVLASILGLEIMGRSIQSDLQDGIAAMGLICLVGLVAAWHKNRPLGWVKWLVHFTRKLGERARNWKYDHGIDFRGTPPIPSRWPGAVGVMLAALLLWSASSIAVWLTFPGGWRDLGVQTSYVVYLIGMMTIWTSLLIVLFLGVFVPVELLNRRLRETTSDSDRRAILFISTLAYSVMILAAAALLPLTVVILCCVIAMGFASVYYLIPHPIELSLLWRSSTHRGPFSIPIHRLLSGGIIVCLLLFLNLILSSAGGRLLSPTAVQESMPLTGSLGALMGWTIPGLLLLIAWRAWSGRDADPARLTPPTLHLLGAMMSQEIRQVAMRRIRNWGWTVRDRQEPPTPGDVRAELVPTPLSEAFEFQPRWPLKVSVEDLENRIVHERFDRRDELQLRHRFYRRIRRLFKLAAKQRRGKGGGYWFAPHWWFIESLGREDGGRSKRTDDGEGTLRPVGPTYEEVFGRRVRQYLYRVFRAVQIDVVFVEDGVSLRSLSRVMRNVFEVYDIHGGQRIVDDHCFQGLPKIRVTVLEFSPLNPHAVVSYKQPKFDELSRGRVLHIFKDYGDQVETDDIPMDFSWEPTPLARL